MGTANKVFTGQRKCDESNVNVIVVSHNIIKEKLRVCL